LQTGSGKTHTMLGNEECKGLIFRSIDKIFEAKLAMENGKESAWKVELKVEMLEIHNEKVNDLLAKGGDGKDLQLTDNEVVGSTVVRVRSVGDVNKVLNIAQAKRATKATNMNDVSSRSHMIFKVMIDAEHETDDTFTRHGVLHICDLAGSERLSKSLSNENKELLKETQSINGSLHALSNVIEKLQKNEEHVPFRDSKLTYMLQNSLGGDSKTLAIVCCSPLPTSFHESVCSLRFANKVNKVELQKLSSFDA
jgi:kinesin family protein C1